MRYEAGKEVTFVPCSSTASKCIQMSLGRSTAASPGLSDLLTQSMDYFFWGYIKSKVYVKEYENISDVKAAIISAF